MRAKIDIVPTSNAKWCWRILIILPDDVAKDAYDEHAMIRGVVLFPKMDQALAAALEVAAKLDLAVEVPA